MKAGEFDKAFDASADTSGEGDRPRALRPNADLKRVNADLPAGVGEGLDRQAQRLGVTRQPPIRVWIADRLGQDRSA